MINADSIHLPQIEINDESQAPLKPEQSLALTVDQEQISQQGAISVTDFLSQQGIVDLQQNSALQNQSGISIRGFGANASSNSLILIDGLPLSSFTHIGPNLNSLLIDTIETVDILVGSYGSRYGNQAVGGVVDIMTAIPQRDYQKMSLAVGNRNQHMAEYFVSHHAGSWAYSLGGTAWHDDHQLMHNRQNKRNFNVKIEHQGETNLLSMNILALSTQIEMPQALRWGQANNTPVVFSHNHSDLDSVISYIKDDWQVNEDWLLSFAMAWQGQSLQGVMAPFNTQSHQRLGLLQFNAEYQQQLISGVTWQHQYYDLVNQLQNNRVNAEVFEGFLRGKMDFSDSIYAVAGIRYASQHLQANVKGVTSKAPDAVIVDEQSLYWDFIKHWQWYLRRDTNYRFAKANEKIWVVDNLSDLNTQTGTSYESGVKYRDGASQLSVGIYRLNLDNEIAYDPMPTALAPFGKMSNLAPTRRTGLDMVYQQQLNLAWQLTAQLSAVDARFRQGVYQSKKIPGVSPLGASVALQYKRDKWLAYINQSYHSSFYPSNDLANTAPQMPGYWLSDIYVARQLDEGVDFGVQVNNLFDKHYVRYASFWQSSVSQIDYYPADGISVLAKLTAKIS